MFNNEDLSYLKKDDSYHFSIPFEYIKKNYGDDNYDIETAYMEVDVRWDEYEQGYKMYYSCSEEYLIDPREGNGTLEEFWENDVEDKVRDELSSYGIYTDAICCFASRG